MSHYGPNDLYVTVILFRRQESPMEIDPRSSANAEPTNSTANQEDPFVSDSFRELIQKWRRILNYSCNKKCQLNIQIKCF